MTRSVSGFLKLIWACLPVWQGFITLPLSYWITQTSSSTNNLEAMTPLLIGVSAILAILAGLGCVYTTQIARLGREYEFSISFASLVFLTSYILIVCFPGSIRGEFHIVSALLILGLAMWQLSFAYSCLNSFKQESLQRKIYKYLAPLRAKIEHSEKLIKNLKILSDETDNRLLKLLGKNASTERRIRHYKREEERIEKDLLRAKDKLNMVRKEEEEALTKEKDSALSEILLEAYQQHPIYNTKGRARSIAQTLSQCKISFLSTSDFLRSQGEIAHSEFNTVAHNNAALSVDVLDSVNGLANDASVLRGNVSKLVDGTAHFLGRYENIFAEVPQLVQCSTDKGVLEILERQDFLSQSIKSLDHELKTTFYNEASNLDLSARQLDQKASSLKWTPDISCWKDIDTIKTEILKHSASLSTRLKEHRASVSAVYTEKLQPPSVAAAGFIMARNLEWFELPVRMLAIGSTGAGKSMFLEMALYPIYKEISRLGRLEPESRLKETQTRVLIFDVAGDTLPFIDSAGVQPKQRFFLNPYDERGAESGFVGWDAAKDLTSRDAIVRFTEILLPDEENATSNHFNRLVRQVLQLVMIVLQEEKKDDWSLYEALFVATHMETLEYFLEKEIYGYRDLKTAVFGRAEHGSDVFSTMQGRLSDLKRIAALWQQRKGKISIREWLNTSSVLALSRLGGKSIAMDRLNQALIQLFADITEVESPNVNHLTTTVVIDEATLLSPLPGVSDLCIYGRKKGVSVYLAFQSIPEAIEKMGEGSLKAMLGQCDIVALLRTSCRDTAAWMSQRCGEYQKEEYLFDITLGESVQDSETFTTGENQSVARGQSKTQTTGTTDTKSWNKTNTNSVSQAVSEGTTDTVGNTYSQGQSYSLGKSQNIGTSNTVGRSASKNFNRTTGKGRNWGHTFAEGWRDGEGWFGWGFGNDTHTDSDQFGGNKNWSKSNGHSSTENTSQSRNQGQSASQTQSVNKGTSTNRSRATNQSKTNTTSQSVAYSEGGSYSVNQSESTGESETQTIGSSQSTSTGQQRGRSRSVTMRQQREYRPRVEETEFLDQHHATKRSGMSGVIIARDLETERNVLHRVNLAPTVVDKVRPRPKESGVKGFIMRASQKTERMVMYSDLVFASKYLKKNKQELFSWIDD